MKNKKEEVLFIILINPYDPNTTIWYHIVLSNALWSFKYLTCWNRFCDAFVTKIEPGRPFRSHRLIFILLVVNLNIFILKCSGKKSIRPFYNKKSTLNGLMID